MKSVKILEKEAFKQMEKEFGYKNPNQVPHFTKVVISSGVGSIKDKKKIELISDRLTKITGQKAAKRTAKKSLASFKSREGDLVGYQITLRGARMYDFIDRLLAVSLPRTRDFRGIPKNSIDDMGNYTLGIREHTIFPETADEELKDVFGLAITFVTTGSAKKETGRFLELIGFPFKKA